jgi:hypothetical protein
MQGPTFEIEPTRVYPDRQRTGKPKTIFNLLDIPTKVGSFSFLRNLFAFYARL